MSRDQGNSEDGQGLTGPFLLPGEDPIVGHLGTSTEERKFLRNGKGASSHLPKNTGPHAPGSDSHSLPLLVTDFAFALVEPRIWGTGMEIRPLDLPSPEEPATEQTQPPS